jgi:hypothetical protein
VHFVLTTEAAFEAAVGRTARREANCFQASFASHVIRSVGHVKKAGVRFLTDGRRAVHGPRLDRRGRQPESDLTCHNFEAVHGLTTCRE